MEARIIGRAPLHSYSISVTGMHARRHDLDRTKEGAYYLGGSIEYSNVWGERVVDSNVRERDSSPIQVEPKSKRGPGRRSLLIL